LALANSEVYHNNPSCQTGNSIAPENVQQGTGDKSLCGECESSTVRAAL
jgi:hypothetical protein